MPPPVYSISEILNGQNSTMLLHDMMFSWLTFVENDPICPHCEFTRYNVQDWGTGFFFPPSSELLLPNLFFIIGVKFELTSWQLGNGTPWNSLTRRSVRLGGASESRTLWTASETLGPRLAVIANLRVRSHQVLGSWTPSGSIQFFCDPTYIYHGPMDKVSAKVLNVSQALTTHKFSVEVLTADPAAYTYWDGSCVTETAVSFARLIQKVRSCSFCHWNVYFFLRSLCILLTIFLSHCRAVSAGLFLYSSALASRIATGHPHPHPF